MPLLPSIFLPQRPRRKFHQQRHFPTGSSGIPQEFLSQCSLLGKMMTAITLHGKGTLGEQFGWTYGAQLADRRA